jgi:hypothetical protein
VPHPKSGLALDGVSPISQRHSEKQSCQHSPEVHNPYSALEIMRMCQSISPNSGPLTITSFLAVAVSLEVSITYICGPEVCPIKLSKESNHS